MAFLKKTDRVAVLVFRVKPFVLCVGHGVLYEQLCFQVCLMKVLWKGGLACLLLAWLWKPRVPHGHSRSGCYIGPSGLSCYSCGQHHASLRFTWLYTSSTHAHTRAHAHTHHTHSHLHKTSGASTVGWKLIHTSRILCNFPIWDAQVAGWCLFFASDYSFKLI